MEGYIGCCVFFSVLLQISATVAPIGVKFFMMVHIDPGQFFSRLGALPPGSPSETLGINFGNLIANISKTVSRSVISQLELNISSTRAF